MPNTKAGINLGQLARRAYLNNEYFILEKDGIPAVARVVGVFCQAFAPRQMKVEFLVLATSHFLGDHPKPAIEDHFKTGQR